MATFEELVVDLHQLEKQLSDIGAQDHAHSVAENKKLIQDIRQKRNEVAGFLYEQVPNHLLVYVSESLPPSSKRLIRNRHFPQDLSRGTRIWAVLIGVDAYTTLRDLSGASRDANEMATYLMDRLSVPKEHIRCLISTVQSPPTTVPATRTNILKTLYDHLYNNREVQKDDILLFYFAGYGSSYRVDGVQSDIQALCPADRGSVYEGSTVPDITDRELDAFFQQLERKKCGKIFVILDCSFGGGHDRPDGAAATGCIRTAPPLPIDLAGYPFPADSIFRRTTSLEEHVSLLCRWNCRASTILFAIQRYLYSDDRVNCKVHAHDIRHVIISVEGSLSLIEGGTPLFESVFMIDLPEDDGAAGEWVWSPSLSIFFACRPYEDAREYKCADNPRGFFTASLLQCIVLRDIKPDASLCDQITECMPHFGNRPSQRPYVIDNNDMQQFWFH
ncbi:hypothetical protein EIP86_004881 [Pleurotus ostreatoroseus]|nr:hypothetical protein EIP86_004881 [Pleurotus ostreatoroseus]